MVSPSSALLRGYQYATLLRIAEFNAIQIAGPQGDKAALIQALAGELFDHKRVLRALAGLTSLEHAILFSLVPHGGKIETRVFCEQLERQGTVAPDPREEVHSDGHHSPLEPSAQSFSQLISRLTLYGLVFSSGTAADDHSTGLTLAPGRQLIVPKPVLECLRQAPVAPLEWGRGKLPAPFVETGTDIAQRELLIYWSFVCAQPLPVTQAGLVQKRVLRSLNQQLLAPDSSLTNATDEGESHRLYFLRLLLQQLGLLVRRRGQIHAAEVPDRASHFWDQLSERRTDACLRAWVNLRDWNELSSLRLSSLELDLPAARSALLQQLRTLPPTRWLSAERFLSRLNQIAPRLLFGIRQAHSTNWHERQQPDEAQLSGRLAEIEAGFVGGSLSGPLHWLGIVDICTDGDRVLAFRVNASGARALRTGPIVENGPARQGKLIVQPNFHIFALGPVPEGSLARLEVFADRVHVDRSVFEYRLSRESVYRAQQKNWAVADISAFLEGQASVPVPQNVRRTLQGWGEQHTRITFHRSVSLMEVGDSQLLERLWDDSAVRIHLERRLTETVAIIRRRRVAALREVLLERELLPMHSPEDRLLENRVQVSQNGQLQPLSKGPDMLLHARLRRLAEERDGKLYVTEAAVTGALAEGVSAAEYLHELATLHNGPLPPALVSRIKVWGRYYGKAYLRETVLLEVKDSSVARELLANSKLSRMLSHFRDDPEGKILLVHTDDLEALRLALREHGVELT